MVLLMKKCMFILLIIVFLSGCTLRKVVVSGAPAEEKQKTTPVIEKVTE